jgi:hypothetical protein
MELFAAMYYDPSVSFRLVLQHLDFAQALQNRHAIACGPLRRVKDRMLAHGGSVAALRRCRNVGQDGILRSGWQPPPLRLRTPPKGRVTIGRQLDFNAACA